jgi:hypothetical protein
MRATQDSWKIALTLVLTLFVFAISSCAPIEMKKVVIQRTDHYKFTSQQQGLRISVDPYVESGRLQDSFGCDLLSRGIIPVLVVVENLSAEDAYMIVSEKARLLTMDAINSRHKTDEVEQARKRLQTWNTVLAVSPLFGLGLAALPFTAVAERSFQNEIEIRKNLEQKQLVPKTIYQGSSHSGFLYFDLGKREDLGKVDGISLTVRNVRTNEISSFTIDTGRL